MAKKMNENQNKCSIIMPLYNGAKYIKKSLNSIMNQTYKNIEIIIIDDCSTDNSIEIVEKIKLENPNVDIKIFKNKTNQGLIKNRNKGASLAQGEYIMSFDYDDLLSPNHIEIMLNEFDDTTSFVHCGTILIDENDEILEKIDNHIEKEKWNKHFMVYASFFNFVSGAGAMISKKYIEKVGGWEEKYRNFGDWHLWIKLAHVGTPKYTEKTMGYYRQHNDGSNMHSDTVKHKDYPTFRKECAILATSYIDNLPDKILQKYLIMKNIVFNSRKRF